MSENFTDTTDWWLGICDRIRSDASSRGYEALSPVENLRVFCRYHLLTSAEAHTRVEELIEFGSTRHIFTNPTDRRTQDYITGRFG